MVSVSPYVRRAVFALIGSLVSTIAFASEPGIEISYGPKTESCPPPAALHRALGKAPAGVQVKLQFRSTPSHFQIELLVSGRLNGRRLLEASTCRELESAIALNIKLLDHIAGLTGDQERARRVAALLTAGVDRVSVDADAFRPSDGDIAEAELRATVSHAQRLWLVSLPVPEIAERHERWSPMLDFIGLVGVVRNGALAGSGGVSWRFREDWRIAAALIFGPPLSVQSGETSTSTALIAVSTGVCRTLIRNWSLSSLEACASVVSGAIHIAARNTKATVSADTPWLGLAGEFVLDASITRNIAARLRGGILVPFYNPSTSLPELAGAYESLKLGALTGVGLVAHFE